MQLFYVKSYSRNKLPKKNEMGFLKWFEKNLDVLFLGVAVTATLILLGLIVALILKVIPMLELLQ